MRLSFGDVHFLGQCLVCTVRRRHWACMRIGWWTIRETQRQGTWRSYTLRQHLALRRRMRHRRRERR